MLKIKAKSEAEKKKPGRKASGLRELPPEAALYAVSKASYAAVRDALALKTTAARLPGATGDAPSLARLLKGDLEIASLRVPEDGEVVLRPVLRSANHQRQLRQAGVPYDLLFVANAFVEDVERATVGKLTASYGEGLGGGTSGEPERVFHHVLRLAKAQEDLTRNERTALWAALVFCLPLHDIGWALHGGRGWTKTHLTEAAALHLEAALGRMERHYKARA